MGASPLRLQPFRRGVPTLPSRASLLAMIVAALSTGCDTQPPTPMPASSTPTPSASLGTVPGTATPSPGARKPASRKPRLFDHTVVQDAVYGVLTRHYRIDDVQLVICPPNRPVVRGTTFRCTAKIAGERKLVPIRVTSDEGDYQVGRPESPG